MSKPALFNNIVHDIERCPRCGVSSPLLNLISKATKHYKESNSCYWWHFTCECSKCKRHVLFYGCSSSENDNLIYVRDMFPELDTVEDAWPERAKKFMQQALESKHAPDGALMLASSAVDAMFKEIGYKKGSLYDRIEEAAGTGILTPQMREWAHEIRLSANEPRHADDDFDGATIKDADQIIEFSKALGEYLFVLPAKVKKWKALAEEVK